MFETYSNIEVFEQRRLESLLRRIQRGEALERSPTTLLLSQRFEIPWPWKRATH